MNNTILKMQISFILVLFSGATLFAQIPNFKKLSAEIQSVQKQFVPDKRVAILTVELTDTIKSVITIKGESNIPEGKTAILQLLKSKGIGYVDSVKVLPAASLGEKVWALTSLSVSNMRAQPDHAAEMVSQTLMGTPLKVLEYDGGWYRVQSPDMYIGWMESFGLKLFTEAEMLSWKKSNRFVYNQISGNAFDSPKQKEKVTDLVMGDLFEVEAEAKGFLKIRMPDGRSGFVKKSECLSWQVWTSRKPDAQSVISVAKQLIGEPYMWGGTSSKSVDCSGLTKSSYYTQGIILARDASQQARYGGHPDFNQLSNLEPGDLLFFGRNIQHVTHVGMYIGDGKYIHSSGLVRINSIDPKDPAYNLSERKSLLTTSRILNSLNTEGIVLVKDHPWYSIINR